MKDEKKTSVLDQGTHGKRDSGMISEKKQNKWRYWHGSIRLKDPFQDLGDLIWLSHSNIVTNSTYQHRWDRLMHQTPRFATSLFDNLRRPWLCDEPELHRNNICLQQKAKTIYISKEGAPSGLYELWMVGTSKSLPWFIGKTWPKKRRIKINSIIRSCGTPQRSTTWGNKLTQKGSFTKSLLSFSHPQIIRRINPS